MNTTWAAPAYADVLVACILVPRSPTTRHNQGLCCGPLVLMMKAAVRDFLTTTHDRPTFIEEGIMHYCVPTFQASLLARRHMRFKMLPSPYILEIVNKGVEQAINNLRLNPDGDL
jgi:alanine dehydrogenase